MGVAFVFRYLNILKGKRYKAPKLSSQREWSGDFYHFVNWTLSSSPSKRPTAEDVLRDSDFVKKSHLGRDLMLVFLKKSSSGPEEDELNTATQRLEPNEEDKVIVSQTRADANSGMLGKH